jgi:transcriptional regulator with XRE-family HTH domain
MPLGIYTPISVCYGSGMTSLTRETWRNRVRQSGLTLIELAERTGKSFSAVYAYSSGARRPSDAWVASVEAVLHDYANEWTCSACGTRNGAERHGCRACARAYDGYSPSILRPTSHGTAQ